MQDLCLVIPCYNEEHRLPRQAMLAFLDVHPDVTLCFVDDGSADGTLGVLQALRDGRPGQILVHALSPNVGKAAAVRAGVRHVASNGAWGIIGYWDADLSAPLTEVDRLLQALRDDPRCQLAMGSRVKLLGSKIERRAARHVLGRVFATAASRLLGFPVYDSQCGAKLFRRDVVEVLFDEPFLTRWLFDLEMLARLRNRHRAAAVDCAREVPLSTWTEVGGSKLRLREMIRVPIELLKIRWRYNLTAH